MSCWAVASFVVEEFTLEEFSSDKIQMVRDAVYQVAQKTPLIPSPWLSELVQAEVHLKCECLQITGSFKIRGAAAALSQGGSGQERGVWAASTGNHGAAVAYAARQLQVPCTIVVPNNVPEVKLKNIKRLGARVVHAPFEGYDQSQEWALDREQEFGGRYISPFENPWVVAGNGGTTGMEILDELPQVATIVSPCGGGGLLAGLGLALEEAGSAAGLIGVNSEASPGMFDSFREGRPLLKVESQPTLADGTEGGVGRITYQLVRNRSEQIIQVSERSIGEAIGSVARNQKLILEGAGALGVAALLEAKVKGAVVVVVLSGSNIDWQRFLALASAAG